MKKKEVQGVYQRTFQDEIKRQYKEKLDEIDKQIKQAEDRVECEERSLETCFYQDRSDYARDVEEAKKALQAVQKQKEMMVAELQDILKDFTK